MPELTQKQKRFVVEYIVDQNATQAAIRAGYSQKTAVVIGSENLTKPYIKTAIDAELEKIRNERMATASEVIEYLTSVLRGKSESEIVVVEGRGDGVSKAQHVKKNPDEKERIKAAEVLAKYHGLLVDRVKTEGGVSVIISGADKLED